MMTRSKQGLDARGYDALAPMCEARVYVWYSIDFLGSLEHCELIIVFGLYSGMKYVFVSFGCKWDVRI